MAEDAVRPAPRRCPHYNEAVRQRACECLNTAIGNDQDLKKQIRSGHWSLRVGNVDDGPANTAWGIFQQEVFFTKEDKEAQKRMHRENFYRLLQTWAQRWFDGTNKQCKQRHYVQPGLSAKQMKRLCYLMGTPLLSETNGSHYWRDLQDALDRHPRKSEIADLVAASDCSLAALERKLKARRPGLAFGIVDARSQLPPATLRERKHMAAVWRGEIPWLQKLVDELAVPFDKASRKFVPPVVRYIFWKDPWPVMQHFTMQLDAFSLKDTTAEDRASRRGFYPTDRAFPPELKRRHPSDTAARKLMMYIIVNVRFGNVLGEDVLDICYHGSTPTRSAAEIRHAREQGEEDVELHDPEFKSWCAPLPSFQPEFLVTNKPHSRCALTCSLTCRWSKVTDRQLNRLERIYRYSMKHPRFCRVRSSSLQRAALPPLPPHIHLLRSALQALPITWRVHHSLLGCIHKSD